jgi:NAD(P)-dependent dehydrogenase (short-subunit alcohol dehydrogenase family)
MSAKDKFDVSGKVTIVTGAARGMGEALATGFAESGAKVAVADLSGDGAEAVAKKLNDAGGTAIAVQVDHTDADQVKAMREKVESELGPIDVLINNAAILSLYNFIEMEMDQWDHVMNVNLRGPLLCMKEIMPGMVERKRGSVINIGSSYSSRSAIMNFPAGGPDYCVSKSGIQALTRCAAQTVAPDGVRVNSIGPGVVDTPMHADNYDLIHGMLPYIPLNRLQTSDDIVGAALYLASDASSYMTGQSLHINGGMLMVD